jgi:hypothetical protein
MPNITDYFQKKTFGDIGPLCMKVWDNPEILPMTFTVQLSSQEFYTQ